MIAKIIPSPDWFVGIDSVDLCEDGDWLPELSIDLDPMDGGTDMGYTFTAPNWPEEVPKPVTVITSTEPHHDANSFYYPNLKKLPTIARITFAKVKSLQYLNNIFICVCDRMFISYFYFTILENPLIIFT